MRRRKREPDRPSGLDHGRRLRRALVAAALVHLLLLLLPLGVNPPAPPAEQRLEVELVEPVEPAKNVEPAAEAGPPRSTAAPSVPSEARLPHALNRKQRRPGQTRRATRSTAVIAKTVSDAGPDTGPNTEPAPPIAGPFLKAPKLDLFPETLLARLAGGDAPDEPISEEARIRSRVHTFVRELQARDRVSVGLVDPYFRELGVRFRDRFDPSWTVFDPKVGNKGLGGALRGWMKDWSATAGRYASTGSPYRAGERDTALLRGGRGHPPDTTVSGAAMLGGMKASAALRDLWNDQVHGRAGGVELLALVRVTQSPDGGLLEVEIETPSGRPAYDRLALHSVRKALVKPLVPPRMGEGLGLRGETIESLWAFRTRFSVVPPAFTIAPMAGIGGLGSMASCDLDTSGGLGECFTPLSRHTFPHLELVAVY